MKGNREKKNLRYELGVLAQGLALGASMILISVYLHISGFVFGVTANIMMGLVLHPRNRALTVEVERAINMQGLSVSERESVQRCIDKEVRSRKRFGIIVALSAVPIIVGAIYFSQYVVDSLVNAENIIIERQLTNQ
jgi:hypothetical protein